MNHSYSTKPCNCRQKLLAQQALFHQQINLNNCCSHWTRLLPSPWPNLPYFWTFQTGKVFPLPTSYVCFWFFWCCFVLGLFFFGWLVLFWGFFNQNMLFSITHSGSPLPRCLFKFFGLKIPLICGCAVFMYLLNTTETFCKLVLWSQSALTT